MGKPLKAMKALSGHPGKKVKSRPRESESLQVAVRIFRSIIEGIIENEVINSA